jgi:protein-tyrosine kinase
MSRLKDALDKAGNTNTQGGVAGGDTAVGAPKAVVSEWQFDDAELHRVERVTVEAPPIPERPAAPSLPPDLWGRYPFGKDFRGKVVVGPETDPTVVEQFRRLGAALHHHQLQSGARTVMVTSAAPAEGKTLTAANLALTLSESYARQVLLIDADLRQPSIHRVLQLPSSPGLTENLLSTAQGPLPIHRISPTFSVLTAGRPSADPMSGLVSDTMTSILMQAAQRFDWVIVDTPPVALLPDANLLAAMIDTALLVVGANRTPYPLITRAVQAIGEQRILGVVLNRINDQDLISPYDYYGNRYQNYGGDSTNKRPRRGLFRGRGPEENAGA